MLRSAHLLFSLFLLGLTAFAQTNDWAPVGATWWYDQEQVSGPEDTYLRISSVKDTLVMGHPCRKLIKKSAWQNGASKLGVLFTYEDSGKVYQLNPKGTQFQLWFDFSVNVGDTVTVFPEAGDVEDSLALRIDSVKNVMLNSTSRKKIFYHPVDQSFYLFGWFWIENIGSNYFFTPQPAVQDPPQGGPFRCYEDTSIGLVHLVSYACDSVYTSVEQIDGQEAFPVLLVHQQLYYNFREPTHLRLFDALGRLVLDQSGLSGQNVIPIPEYLSGCVIVQVQIGDKVRSQPFIIR